MSQRQRVALALSGGVDSAVAAALLKRQGVDLHGVYLRLSPEVPPPAHLEALAQKLGLPLKLMDLRQEFARDVLDYLVSEYSRGRTPNPCVRCNALIKFGCLWKHLQEAGFTHLATGHYARLGPVEGGPALFRGVDRRKDQSYFLSRLPRSLLPYILFPLGEITKEEVRRISREVGLPIQERARESMELCFLPEGGYREFLRTRRGGAPSPGDFVDPGGRVVGRHQGVECYTVGQRRGLGIPARQPYYVKEIQPETNRVVLGHGADLLSSGLTASHLNWLTDPPNGEWEAVAVIRYRHPGVPARITPEGPGVVRVAFGTPQSAVAPGQAVVFYEGDRVLAGGWIECRIP